MSESAASDLLLVPGLLLSADLWSAQVAGLSDLCRPRVTTAQMEHDSIAAIATAILAEAPPTFALAGMSMGGYVALEILRQAPGRVARLALISTSAAPDAPVAREQRRALVRQSKFGSFTGISRVTFAQWVHPVRAADQALFQRVKAMTQALGREIFARQQTAAASRADYRPLLPAIACPALVLCGREDRVTPLTESEAIAAAIPGAVLAVVEQCGHLSPLEQPAAVTRAMRAWLAA